MILSPSLEATPSSIISSVYSINVLQSVPVEYCSPLSPTDSYIMYFPTILLPYLLLSSPSYLVTNYLMRFI